MKMDKFTIQAGNLFLAQHNKSLCRTRRVAVFICCLILSSCGCGLNVLYNWRPKPWTHPYVANTYTGLDTLININGYYVSQVADTLHFDRRFMSNSNQDTTDSVLIRMEYNSIMFYNNGLCASLSTRVSASDDKIIPFLDTLYSNRTFANKYRNESRKGQDTSWGTYEVHNDTIKTFLIEDLIGCDGTRKNIVSGIYILSDDRELKHIYTSNTNKGYGYKKTLDIPRTTFYSIENKRDSTECPYLKKKWFYKKDKVN